jgi:DNA topoisomerase VI subunit A
VYNSTADNEVPAKPKFSVQFILLVKIALNNVLELYEVIVNFFYFFFCLAEQSVVDRAINDICILLQCSRHNLNVVDATLVSP